MHGVVSADQGSTKPKMTAECQTVQFELASKQHALLNWLDGV
jgi:hypothetical protein